MMREDCTLLSCLVQIASLLHSAILAVNDALLGVGGRFQIEHLQSGFQSANLFITPSELRIFQFADCINFPSYGGKTPPYGRGFSLQSARFKCQTNPQGKDGRR